MLIDLYIQAGINAKEAGFDGVEREHPKALPFGGPPYCVLIYSSWRGWAPRAPVLGLHFEQPH